MFFLLNKNQFKLWTTFLSIYSSLISAVTSSTLISLRTSSMYLISNSLSGALDTPTGITVWGPGRGVVSAISSIVVSLVLREGGSVDVDFVGVEAALVVVDLVVVEAVVVVLLLVVVVVVVVDKVAVEVVDEDDIIVVVVVVDEDVVIVVIGVGGVDVMSLIGSDVVV